MSDLQPADFETADYRTVLRRLTTLDADAADMRVEAVRWHDERVLAADNAVRAADDDLRAARLAVGDAQRELEEVDARAAGLWADFVHKVGPAAERFGRTLPQASIPRQRGELRPAVEYLDEVANKVAYTPPARPLTSVVKLLFGVFGFLGGLAGAVVYQAVRHAGAVTSASWRDAAPVLALLALLACPVLAVLGAKQVADRRGVGLDAATVATVLITGLITATLILVAVRS
ncbi:hypothetical protein ACWKSP_16910 [Micromonosporaceae bacterium Da 78-11]